MIEEILPSTAAVVEARGDSDAQPLFPEEEALVGHAVERRREEFAGGRACARAALERLGRAAAPILAGERGEPLWPAGVVGSITHCAGYRAAVVAPSSELLALGIDAEPHAPLRRGLIRRIARGEEQAHLADLSRIDPTTHWDRLLFSAKESTYKAWSALTPRWLGLKDTRLTIDRMQGTFEVRLLGGRQTAERRTVDRFDGAWLVRDGFILTAIALTAQGRDDRSATQTGKPASTEESAKSAPASRSCSTV